MPKLEHTEKIFSKDGANEVILYKDLNVETHSDKFVTIIGSNGSGKPTFFDVISGNIRRDAGSVPFNRKDVSRLPKHKHFQLIGRVFQDPQKGTSPSLVILQNMAMAYHRGKSFSLTKGVDKTLIPLFKRKFADMQLGLKSKLHVNVGSLSSGQEQALLLLVATLITPQLLLLGEHTATLDSKTNGLVIQLTKKVTEEKKVTTITIARNLKYTIICGGRLLMSHGEEIIMNMPKEEKRQLAVGKLIEKFSSLSMLDVLGDELAFGTQ